MQNKDKEKTLKIIGNNIQAARKAVGREIKDVAHQLAITPQAYGNIENGKTDISLSRALQLADIFKTNYQQLLNIENTKFSTYNAPHNKGDYNMLHAETVHISVNDKLIAQLEKNLADKDTIIELLQKKSK